MRSLHVHTKIHVSFKNNFAYQEQKMMISLHAQMFQ